MISITFISLLIIQILKCTFFLYYYVIMLPFVFPPFSSFIHPFHTYPMFFHPLLHLLYPPSSTLALCFSTLCSASFIHPSTLTLCFSTLCFTSFICPFHPYPVFFYPLSHLFIHPLPPLPCVFLPSDPPSLSTLFHPYPVFFHPLLHILFPPSFTLILCFSTLCFTSFIHPLSPLPCVFPPSAPPPLSTLFHPYPVFFHPLFHLFYPSSFTLTLCFSTLFYTSFIHPLPPLPFVFLPSAPPPLSTLFHP